MQKSDKAREIIRAVKFTLISISAGVIQIGSFTLLYEALELKYWLAYLVSLLLSIIWNFTINRKVTFKSATNVPKAMAQLLGFYAVFTPTTMLLGQWVEGMGVHGIVVEAVTMLLNFVLEFLFCRFFVYRNKMYTNDLGKAELEKMAQSENAES